MVAMFVARRPGRAPLTVSSLLTVGVTGVLAMSMGCASNGGGETQTPGTEDPAALVTPNLPEAALLTRRDIDTPDDMKRAADTLMNAGAHAALIKGGHGTGNVVTDLLALQSGFELFEHERLETSNTHGTGCTLSSAIAGQLAAQIAGGISPDLAPDLRAATEQALAYVQAAIKNAPNLGRGNGPLGH